MPNVPTEAEVIAMMDSLSNWGRWGDDDQLGTLNYVTPEVRRAAAGLVTEGVSVSCAWDIENTHEPDHAMGTPQRFMVSTGESAAAVAESGVSRMSGALEFFGLVYHGYAITHLDGLCHIFWDGQMYNGKPAHLVNSGGRGDRPADHRVTGRDCDSRRAARCGGGEGSRLDGAGRRRLPGGSGSGGRAPGRSRA